MALGLTNGTQTMGLSYSGNVQYGLWGARDNYGSTIGITPYGDPRAAKTVGITADPAKSGVVANLNDTDIGAVNSLELGKYIVKY